mgnify:CR=1 FL=1
MEKDNMITEAIESTTVSQDDDYERNVKEIEDWSDKLLYASIYRRLSLTIVEMIL